MSPYYIKKISLLYFLCMDKVLYFKITFSLFINKPTTKRRNKKKNNKSRHTKSFIVIYA